MATQSTLEQPSLLPEFIGNLLESVNSTSRIILKTSLAVERGVDGVDKLATTALTIQSKRLEAKLEAL